jgi:hypothetical protein
VDGKKRNRREKVRKVDMDEKEIVEASEAVSLDEILGFDREKERQEEKEGHDRQ